MRNASSLSLVAVAAGGVWKCFSKVDKLWDKMRPWSDFLNWDWPVFGRRMYFKKVVVQFHIIPIEFKCLPSGGGLMSSSLQDRTRSHQAQADFDSKLSKVGRDRYVVWIVLINAMAGLHWALHGASPLPSLRMSLCTTS